MDIVNEPDNAAIAFLNQHGIESTTYAHEAAFTVEEQAQHVALAGALTKNLFLRDKKYGLFLVTTLADREVNMKILAKILNLSGANLRLADEQILMDKLGVTRGSVSPLALINDTNHDVKFCIDSALFQAEIINVHPLRNDRTTSISSQNLREFFKKTGHNPIVLDFASASTA